MYSRCATARGLFPLQSGVLFQRSIYFISESLLILLPKDQLVDTMHDAYRRVPNEPQGEFRGFISGAGGDGAGLGEGGLGPVGPAGGCDAVGAREGGAAPGALLGGER